ncbi:hypothetical protein B9T21_02880 [Wohlfahrtiimonas chitiniclastica]|nr:hypothetical protein B9T21_02880 [Wohlfahrtiimonas chitiniclastica]
MNGPLQAKRAFSFVWKNSIIICLDIILKLTESFFKKDCDGHHLIKYDYLISHSAGIKFFISYELMHD